MKSTLEKPRLNYHSHLPPKKGGFFYREQHKKALEKYFEVKVQNPDTLRFFNFIPILILSPLMILTRSFLRRSRDTVDYVEYDFAAYPLLFLPCSLLWRHVSWCKQIFRLHEDYRNVRFGGLLRLWDNFWLWLIADVIIVHTYEHAELLWAVNRRKGLVLLSGLDVTKHNHKPEQHTIIIPGFITRWKGHDVLIDALSEVRRKIPDVKLIVAGKTHDGMFFEELTKKIIWAGLQDNIELHTDYLDREDLQKLLRRASVAVLPYKRINFSAALLDCIDWEIPTIVSAIPQFKELAPGLPSVSVEDRHALARQIIRLLTSKKEHNSVKKQMKALKIRYDWKPIVKREAEIIYDELGGGK